MKALFLFITLLFSHLNAQNLNNDGPDVRDARFAGGSEQLSKYISQHLRYPESAAVRHIEGEVIVIFTVDATGLICDANIRYGLENGCDEEALRLVQSMPRWEPATLNGRPVACGKTLRINFRMPL